jgi:hypothetical protein
MRVDRYQGAKVGAANVAAPVAPRHWVNVTRPWTTSSLLDAELAALCATSDYQSSNLEDLFSKDDLKTLRLSKLMESDHAQESTAATTSNALFDTMDRSSQPSYRNHVHILSAPASSHPAPSMVVAANPWHFRKQNYQQMPQQNFAMPQGETYESGMNNPGVPQPLTAAFAGHAPSIANLQPGPIQVNSRTVPHNTILTAQGSELAYKGNYAPHHPHAQPTHGVVSGISLFISYYSNIGTQPAAYGYGPAP